MDLRVLGPGDEDLLVRAVAMIGEAELTHERAAAHLADPSLVNLVALVDGEVAGFLYGYVLKRYEARSFFIYSVDVDERFRRRGIAGAMLARLRVMGATRWDEMFVFTNRGNAAAMRLYASAGGVAPPPDDVVMFDFD